MPCVSLCCVRSPKIIWFAKFASNNHNPHEKPRWLQALRRSVPVDMRKYMGIINMPQEEAGDAEDGDDDDSSASAANLARLFCCWHIEC